MNSNNKTIFNYLDGNSTIVQVIKGDKLVSTELKGEITSTFRTLFKSDKIKEINKISVDDKGCFIIRYNETPQVTYVNIPKNNYEHYNAFDSMYIQKNRLNNERIKNLRIVKKTVAGVLVATTLVAGAGAYLHWLNNTDNKTFEVMDETNKVIRESAGFNPQAAYETALDNLGATVEEEISTHRR